MLLYRLIQHVLCCFSVFFQAEDGIRDLVRSRGLGDVYKRQVDIFVNRFASGPLEDSVKSFERDYILRTLENNDFCLLYTSDAADERSSVDLGGRRIIKKKNTLNIRGERITQ